MKVFKESTVSKLGSSDEFTNSVVANDGTTNSSKMLSSTLSMKQKSDSTAFSNKRDSFEDQLSMTSKAKT